MTQGSPEWVVRAVRDWAEAIGQGTGLVVYQSGAARDRVIAELSSALSVMGRSVQTMSVAEWTPQQFVAEVVASDADCLFVIGLDSLLFGVNGDQSPFWINFQRERLVERPGVQVWWMTPDGATRFGRDLPDLSRFFLFRERLEGREVVESEASRSTGERALGTSAPSYVRLFQNRALTAAEFGADPLRVWLELAGPALAALLASGDAAGASELVTALTRQIGPPEGILKSAVLGRELDVGRLFRSLGDLRQESLSNLWDASEIRHAIAEYGIALSFLTESEFPEDWALTQNNLGTAYADLPDGDRAGNLRKAITCFEMALRVYNEVSYPDAWAGAQNNLGVAYANLPDGSRGENLRKAISCFEAAQPVLAETAFPQEWATTQNNLGSAYADLPDGDRRENLGAAINCYEAALRVYTETSFPQGWAATQTNLALAHEDLAQLDEPPNPEVLRKALTHIVAALRVFNETMFPRDYSRAVRIRERILAALQEKP